MCRSWRGNTLLQMSEMDKHITIQKAAQRLLVLAVDSKWSIQPQEQSIKLLVPMVNSVIRQNILNRDLFKCDAKKHGWEREVGNQGVAGSKLWLCNSNGMS